MLSRFQRGVTPAEQDLPAYVDVADHPGDGHDGAEDGDQTKLKDLYPVDPALIRAHRAEKKKKKR
jgi:hypothetical protein